MPYLNPIQSNRPMSEEELPGCPDVFKCSITHLRMVDPVATVDGHTYERWAIEEWFKSSVTSPKTGLSLDSTALLTIHTLRIQIKEWKDDQLTGRADKTRLNALHGELVKVSTSNDAQYVIQQMIQVVVSSNHCLLSPCNVERLKILLKGVNLLDKDITEMLEILASQCQSEINKKQEMHRKLNRECQALALAKTNIIKQEDAFEKMVVKTNKKAFSGKEQMRAARKEADDAVKKLNAITKAVKESNDYKEDMKAEKDLVEYKKRVIDHSKLCSEYLNKRENIGRQLKFVDAMEDTNSGSISSSSSSSSSSLPTGSKRGRSSSSSSSLSTTRESKRPKKEKGGVMEIHPGQSLYEEGIAYYYGLDFKIMNKERGQLMIDASASSGFPLAVAECHLLGLQNFKQDQNKGLRMLQKILNAKGNHWAQNMLGYCYQHGLGVKTDPKKSSEYYSFEKYSLSAEQGNSFAMNYLGCCYDEGIGIDENKIKAFEWYKKSAKLGYCEAMFSVGIDYETGEGVIKDENKAKEWYTKAAAQGHEDAQTRLGELNAQYE